MRAAWWNQYGNLPIAACVQRAKDAHLDIVIVKQGYTAEQDAFAAADIPWATERYVLPNNPEAEGRALAADIARGARFAVINAEIEWATTPATTMTALIATFNELQPTAPLYACTDTRGDRTNLPYQRVTAKLCAGWMPMIYPKAFQQTVTQAFAAALDGVDFHGKPVMPAIQTYDNIGAAAVTDQIIECAARHLAGYGAYTIAHATDAEWSIVTADLHPTPTPPPPTREQRLTAVNAVGRIFTAAGLLALSEAPLPPELKAQLKYLIG